MHGFVWYHEVNNQIFLLDLFLFKSTFLACSILPVIFSASQIFPNVIYYSNYENAGFDYFSELGVIWTSDRLNSTLLRLIFENDDRYLNFSTAFELKTTEYLIRFYDYEKEKSLRIGKLGMYERLKRGEAYITPGVASYYNVQFIN
jgi:hypothetical protein